MITSETQIRVRYAETDRMGYVYYGNYAAFYEVGRVETLRSLGINYRELEDFGVMLPVASMNTRFIRPAFYDDLLRVVTSIPEMPGSRIVFTYKIYNEASVLINEGETTLVFVQVDSKKPCKAPDQLLNLLSPYFHA